MALFRELVSSRQPELARRFFTTDAHRHLGLPILPVPVKVYADSQLLSSDLSVYQHLAPARERAPAGPDCAAMPPWDFSCSCTARPPCVFLCVLCRSVLPYLSQCCAYSLWQCCLSWCVRHTLLLLLWLFCVCLCTCADSVVSY